MEGNACNSMASDMANVKEEPLWDQVTGSHSVSEAPALPGLYADHEVKEELVIGPEVLQAPDAVFTADESREKSELSSGGYHWDHTYAKTESPKGEVHVKEEVVKCLKEEAECEVLTVRERPVLRGSVLGTYTCWAMRHVDNSAHVGNQIHRKTNIVTEETYYGHAPAGAEPIRAGEYRYCCDICQKNFPTPSNLKRHKRIHTGERPFACGICKKTFADLSNLTSHERIHTGERPFACGICKKKFADPSNLKSHKRIHTGERPFTCGICKKKFAESRNLKTHIRIHTGERPFSCEICKQKFAQLSTLKSHERTHTREKPFSCGVCEQKFTQLGHLKRHELIHTKEKPFSCDLCIQKFAHSSTLKIHERTHTGERPYSCGLCKLTFAQLGNLKRHERIHT